MKKHPLVCVFSLLKVQDHIANLEWSILNQSGKIDKELVCPKPLFILSEAMSDTANRQHLAVIESLFLEYRKVLLSQFFQERPAVKWSLEQAAIFGGYCFDDGPHVRNNRRKLGLTVFQVCQFLGRVHVQCQETILERIVGFPACAV